MGKKSKKNKNRTAAPVAQAKSEISTKEVDEKDAKNDFPVEAKADAKVASPVSPSAKGEVTPPSTPTRVKNSPKATTPKPSTPSPASKSPQKSQGTPAAASKDYTPPPSPAKSTSSVHSAKSTPLSSKATPASPLPTPPSSEAKSPARSTMPPAPPSPSAAVAVDKQAIEEVVRRRPSLRDPQEAAISNVLLPSMHAVEHALKPHEAPAGNVSAKLQPTMHALETNLRTGHVKEVLKEHLKEHAEQAEAPTTAPLIANTAAAVKTKIAAQELQKKMERRPSVDALKDSGILTSASVPSPHPLSSPHPTIGTSTNVTPAQQPSSEHILQRQHSRLTESPEPAYRPYATLSRRQVMGIGLKVIAELRKRSLIDDMVSGFVKEKLFVDDVAMIQAVEKFVETQDLDPLASLIYHVQEAVAERNM